MDIAEKLKDNKIASIIINAVEEVCNNHIGEALNEEELHLLNHSIKELNDYFFNEYEIKVAIEVEIVDGQIVVKIND